MASGTPPVNAGPTNAPPLWIYAVRRPLFRSALALLLMVLSGWSIGVGTACAQKAAAGGITKAEIMTILRGKDIPADQKAAFATYFKTFLQDFASATPSTPDRFFRLRGQLKIYLNTGRSGAAHDELNKMTLAAMQKIVASSTSETAARINAVIVIGELNIVDEPPQPKPLPEAYRLLSVIAQSPKFSAELKVAALLGLDRFAAAGSIPAAEKDKLAKLLLDLVKQKDPPANRSVDGHNWMRRQAAAVLVKIYGSAPSSEVVSAIAAMAADPTARLTMRCEMAQLIGQFKLTSASKVDVQSLANTLGHQAVEICSAEIESAQAAKRDLSVRRIMYTLYSVREGLAGLQAAAAETPHKKFVADLYAKVKSMHAELDDPELTTGPLTLEASKKIKELQGMLAP